MATCTECGEEFEPKSIFNQICEPCEDELADEEDEEYDDEDSSEQAENPEYQ